MRSCDVDAYLAFPHPNFHLFLLSKSLEYSGFFRSNHSATVNTDLIWQAKAPPLFMGLVGFVLRFTVSDVQYEQVSAYKGLGNLRCFIGRQSMENSWVLWGGKRSHYSQSYYCCKTEPGCEQPWSPERSHCMVWCLDFFESGYSFCIAVWKPDSSAQPQEVFWDK